MAHKVLLVTDTESGDEAMYFDGELVAHDSTIYAVDIAGKCEGLEVILEHKSVNMGSDWEKFPSDAGLLPDFEEA